MVAMGLEWGDALLGGQKERGALMARAGALRFFFLDVNQMIETGCKLCEEFGVIDAQVKELMGSGKTDTYRDQSRTP